MLSNYIYISRGVFLTLFITVICLFFGMVIGFVAGSCIFFKVKFISIFQTNVKKKLLLENRGFFNLTSLYEFFILYTKFFINTPILTQIFIMYFVVPINCSAFVSGLIVLSLNSGAHVSVIILEALENIPNNHWDTAVSLGFAPIESFKKIFIKYIIITNRKSLFNEFIQLIKESSVLSMFGVREICFRSKEISAKEYNYFPYMLFVSFVYLFIIYIFEKIYNRYIKKL
jgi:ABC-type amino acid transport system permease subunit